MVIIDDNAFSRSQAGAILEAQGFVLGEASDAASGTVSSRRRGTALLP